MARRSAVSSMPAPGSQTRPALEGWLVAGLLLIVLVGSYWPTLVPLYRDWQNDDNYSVGQLVPLAALYLLWSDRKRLAGVRVNPCGWGLALIVVAQLGRIYGLVALYESAERYAFVLTVAGLVLLVGGRALFWRTRWILLFLLLMVPVPGRIHNAISGPLQGMATGLAVGALELMGMVVTREGNTMVLNDRVPVAVAEACSGLRMLTAFIVVASVMAYVIRRAPWQKAALVLSSVLVAILCNQARLVITALLFYKVNSDVGKKFFHEFAGLTMMPLAVLILAGELWIMSRLVINDEQGRGKAHV